MNLVARWGLATVVAGLPAHLDAAQDPIELQPAQEVAAGRSWTAAAWAQGAYQVISGRLATAPSNLVELPLANTVSDLGSSFIVGGGVEIGFPAHDISVRLGGEASMGAEATGQLGICEVAEGLLCQVETAPVDMRGLTAQMWIHRGNPEWPVRPLFGGGFGWRQYSFERPTCSGRASDDARDVCNLIIDMFHGPGSHMVLRVAGGARAKSGRYMSEVVVSGGAGRFAGGTARVNGNWYLDVRIELSAGLQIL